MPDNPDDMPILGTRPTPAVPRTLVSRDELEMAFNYVLGQNRALCPGKWPKGPDGTALARKLAEHLDLCGWEVTRGPPKPMLSTPARVGAALYGPRWQSDLSRDLEVADRTVRRWVAGSDDPPDGLYIDLLRLVQERAAELDALIPLLKEAATP